MELKTLRIPMAGVVGSGVGFATGELTAETIARATGQTGWAKVGVKGIIKGLICGAFYGLSLRLPGLWSLGAEIAGYSSLGSIFFDLFYQLFPGGIWGLAENFAVSLRTWSAGVEYIKAELSALEKASGEEAEAIVY